MSFKKRRTIKSRWLNNILAVTVAILLILATVIIYSVYSRYINTAELTIRARISRTVDSYFSNYNNGDDEMFVIGANHYVENFPYKDIMEIWILDSNAKVVASSNGFGSISTTNLNDYYDALKSYDNTAVGEHKTAQGEKILALSYILRDQSGKNYGALRCLVSLDDAYNQFYRVAVFVTLLFVLIILLITTLGGYFVSSIVHPVEEINRITKEIAKGDFSVRIENNSDDEIGELSDSINLMAKQLSEIDKIKNEFISTVSHEIRTPLTAIKGWSETLKNVGGGNELTDKGLDIIINETGRLSDMVEELLDFSRIQSGNMKIIKDEFDISAVVEEVCIIYQQKAQSEDKTLVADFAQNDNYKIFGDEDKLRQVIINIIDNALKYTPEKGNIQITLERNSKYVIISVCDNGYGISKSDLPHVKEKFYKANNTVRGTGIGLAVADEIVKKHGGELIISSEEGKGTIVEIVLPIFDTEDNNGK